MRPRLSLTVAGLFAASGCASGWQLTLDPARFPNQRPVRPADVVTLVVRDDDGARWLPLGVGADRRWVLADVDPLEGDRLGLLIQAPDADPERLDPAVLQAWGESAPVVGEKGVLVATLALAAFGAPGSLRPLDSPAAGAATAMSADGQTWLFGGADATIQRLADPDSGARSFTTAGDLVDADGDGSPDPTVGAAAVALPDGQILVTGGGAAPGQRSDRAARFDPSDPAWTPVGPLTRPRAGHLAWALPNGPVVLVGGDGEAAPTWEVDTGGGFEDRGPLPLGPAGFAGAEITGGLLLCGGLAVEPVATCVRIAGDVANPAAPLPVPLHAHTLVGLTDGRVLALGGLTGACPDGLPCWASSRAFVYGPADAWVEVGPMSRPRAGAAAVTTPDGRAVVLGGAEALAPVVDPVDCPEVFDGLAFTPRGPCHAALRGVAPIVAFHPDHGAVVVAGYTEEDDGGVEAAFVSTGPPAAVANGDP